MASKKSIAAKLRREKDPVKYRALEAKHRRNYIKRHPEKWREKERNRHYRRAYGITFTQALDLLAGQGWACAICAAPLKGLGGNTHVDHCHKERRVRGILCRTCNMQIGWFERWPEFHKFAAAYLRRENVV